jgi:hypothetical protein
MVVQGLSALMGVAGALSNRGSTKNEAAELNTQSELALEESRLLASQKASEVKAFREDQAQAYNSSGVLLEGSPMVVLSDTIRKGNQEIEAIEKRGKALAQLYRSRAKQTEKAGNYGLLSSVLTGGLGLASAWILGKKIGMFGNKNPAPTPTPSPSPTPAPKVGDTDVSLPHLKFGGKTY